MEIKHWLFTGDCHGVFNRFSALDNNYNPNETAIIILGDAGVNFYLNKTDNKRKAFLNEYGYSFYLVRGNHEERPQNISTMERIYDDIVDNEIYYEPEYPNIRYFIDGYIYKINGYNMLVIGGAYSVDKDYRLTNFMHKDGWCGWFAQEQLSEEEMSIISLMYKDREDIDFVLSHTCPFSWQPTDLFLGSIDQSKVDDSMELWMENLKNEMKWKYWLFGHYHDNRLVRPHVEMLYGDIESLEDFINRWDYFDETGSIKDWWIPKDSNFYIDP